MLLGVSEGGPLCSLFAATYPEKTDALIMVGSYARRIRDEQYPWGPTKEERDAFCEAIVEEWGGFQVAWTMARGYEGQFGRSLNAPWLWIPLCVLFLAPFVDPGHERAAEVAAALARAASDRDWQVRQAAEDIGAVTDD